MFTTFGPLGEEREVVVNAHGVDLPGTLGLPGGAIGVVLFAHGSGSSRHSGRNRYVAQVLRNAGLGTLLFDLLTPQEAWAERDTAHLRFDIGLLADRLAGATGWLRAQPEAAGLPIGYFGASTGGGAALVAAARNPGVVRAVVSRGGRPDLAGDALPRVQAPTLLLVGGADPMVLDMNEAARKRMTAPAELVVVPGASHLFEEPGALDEVAREAARFFVRHLGRTEVPAGR